jgi:RND family efflux transporter MFP subunit
VLAGCAGAPSGKPEAPPTPVAVSLPVERYVTDYADLTARTEAVYSANVTARATGDLTAVTFKEGDVVRGGPWYNPTRGDLLAVIDQRPYKAAVDNKAALLNSARANLAYARASEKVALDNFRVVKSLGVAQTQEEYDQKEGAVKQATANIGVAAANVRSAAADLETATINLRYAEVRAPFTGRVGRRLLEVGNNVKENQTVVANVVSLDPMYAYFDVDESTALRVRQLVREGKSDSPRDGGYPVSLGLANEEGHPHRGAINFVDNQVNPKTGTIRARGVFPNKEQVLLPGLFGRVRVPIGRPHEALLVSDRALDTDQGQKVLYVVNDKNEVVSRPVRVGALHDGLREITEGLRPGEMVVINGLQQVRPGLTVEPKLVDLPQRSEVRGQKSGTSSSLSRF